MAHLRSILVIGLVFFVISDAWGADNRPLAGTAALGGKDDLSAKMVDGAHRFLDRKLAESIDARQILWKRDLSSPAAYEKSVEANRARFKKYIGVIDARVNVVMERFGDERNPALVGQTDRWSAYQVRWSVLEGVFGEGLLLEPKGKALGYVVIIPDADQTPEQLVGLAPGMKPDSQLARRLVENGFRVIVPVLIDRDTRFSGNPVVAMTKQPHREWIYRQAYEMGRHVIGYDVQKVLAAVDWLKRVGGGKLKIGVAGYGEGGLIAFYAAAVDRRIDACLVSGYFDSRQRVWREPIYRNVWGLLHEFGDAEIAGLIVPRELVIEYSRVPQIEGLPLASKGRRTSATPGRLTTSPVEQVRAEVRRIRLPQGAPAPLLLIGDDSGPLGPGSQQALRGFVERLGVESELALSSDIPSERRKQFDPIARQQRQVRQLTAHIQSLLRYSDRVRDQYFLSKVNQEKVEQFRGQCNQYREYFDREVIGRFDEPMLEPKPRSRKIYDEEKWTGYEVVLDVWPEVFAWGILCLPKDIKPGERRPVVVCQHGLEGVPEDTIVTEGTGYRYYKAFTARLAERGFITFAPHNLYRGGDRFRMLQRKANPLKTSLYSLIVPQHRQIINWLETLPQVDPKRIAFYGLSYGGKTAMRVPAIEQRYCLSICSGDFNDWIRKNVAIEFRGSYMFTREWEIYEFDLGRTFNYAEMSYLIAPRPFMVERGHHDSVGLDPWVAYEYAKTRWLYAQLGLADKTEIEYFNGPHTIHGQGTFEFLHKHLNWPKE